MGYRNKYLNLYSKRCLGKFRVSGNYYRRNSKLSRKKSKFISTYFDKLKHPSLYN